MWWLTYLRANRLEVIIVKAGSLVQARMMASIAGLDEGATFREGHELGAALAKRVPKDLIGRKLSRREAAAVLETLGG